MLNEQNAAVLSQAYSCIASPDVEAPAPMAAWSLLIVTGLLLMFLGLFTHWSIIVIGAVLPFVPIALEVLRRRRR